MKKFKTYINQKCGTFNNEEIELFVGYSYEEIINFFKKHKYKKNFLEEINDGNLEKNIGEEKSACCVFYPSFITSIIWLNDFKNDWYYLDILLHEINHQVSFSLKERGMLGELEIFAYQQQFLFKEIRTKLNNELCKFKKK